MSKQITGCILYEMWMYGEDAAEPSTDVTGFKWDLHRRPLTYMNSNVHSLINLRAILTHQQHKYVNLNKSHFSVYCFLIMVDVWFRLLSSDLISVTAGAIQSLNFTAECAAVYIFSLPVCPFSVCIKLTQMSSFNTSHSNRGFHLVMTRACVKQNEIVKMNNKYILIQYLAEGARKRIFRVHQI